MKRIATAIIVALSMVSGSALATAATTPRWFQPVMELPKPAIQTFRCVIHHESTSTFTHPNLGDDNADGGSSGIFQIEQGTWAAHQLAAHVPLSIHVWQATPYQQSLVAVAIYRADGWHPWWYDGCF